MRQRILFIHVLCLFANDDAKFDLQSSFSEFLGITTSSFAPQRAEVAFMNTIGSAGTVIPDSAA